MSYPTILLLCWCFVIVNDIVIHFLSEKRPGVKSYLIGPGIYLQSFSFLQGFLGYLQYLWFERRMRGQRVQESVEVSQLESEILSGTIREADKSYHSQKSEFEKQSVISSIFHTNSIHNNVNLLSKKRSQDSERQPADDPSFRRRSDRFFTQQEDTSQSFYYIIDEEKSSAHGDWKQSFGANRKSKQGKLIQNNLKQSVKLSTLDQFKGSLNYEEK